MATTKKPAAAAAEPGEAPEVEQTAPEPDPAPAVPEDAYERNMLIEASPELLGVRSYVTEVALRRFAPDGDYITREQAEKALARLSNHSVEV